MDFTYTFMSVNNNLNDIIAIFNNNKVYDKIVYKVFYKKRERGKRNKEEKK